MAPGWISYPAPPFVQTPRVTHRGCVALDRSQQHPRAVRRIGAELIVLRLEHVLREVVVESVVDLARGLVRRGGDTSGHGMVRRGGRA